MSSGSVSLDPRQKRSLELAVAAARTADENHGSDIVVLDTRKVSPLFDYFVLATGQSRRQLHAISEEIDHKLEDDLDDQRMGIEGYRESRWILLDYGTVVIHIFDSETREFYDLENLWSDAPRIDWRDGWRKKAGRPLSDPCTVSVTIGFRSAHMDGTTGRRFQLSRTQVEALRTWLATQPADD